MAPIIKRLFAAALLCTACASLDRTNQSRTEPECAIIVTDDDIPSGSATAGAMYVDDSELGRELLTADVVAVAQGFLEAGLRCVDVIDSHDGAIDPAPLMELGVPVLTPSNTEDWTWPFLGPMRKRYVIAALIGFHSNAGQVGFRPHTINDSIRGLRLNGDLCGEVAHLTLGLGAFGVPVGLVSGDMNAVHEATTLVPKAMGATTRWLDDKGEVRFLSSEEAARYLRQWATLVTADRPEPWRPPGPIAISLSTHSSDKMRDLSSTVAEEWRKGAAETTLPGLDDIDFGAARTEDGHLSWAAPNGLAAFVSVAFAAQHFRGNHAWEEVSRGYEAFGDGRPADAVAAYKEALRIDPYDTATRCRLGAVHLTTKDYQAAKQLFDYAVQRMDEIGGARLKSWCWIGLAEAEHNLNNPARARHAARRVLELPDSSQRHEKAKTLLEKLRATELHVRFEIDSEQEKLRTYGMFRHSDPAGLESRAQSMRVEVALARKIRDAANYMEVRDDIDTLVDTAYLAAQPKMTLALDHRRDYWSKELEGFADAARQITGHDWYYPEYVYYVTAFHKGVTSWYQNVIGGRYDLEDEMANRLFGHELLLSHSFHIVREHFGRDELDDHAVWAFSEIAAVLIMADSRFQRFWPNRKFVGNYFSRSNYPQLAELEEKLRAIYNGREDFADFVRRSVPILEASSAAQ